MALSSLSLVTGNRHKDGFLKAGSSAQTRLQFARANRSAKQYAAQASQPSGGDEVGMHYMSLENYFPPRHSSMASTGPGPAGLAKPRTAASVQSADNLRATTQNSTTAPEVWQPRGGTPADPQIVSFHGRPKFLAHTDYQNQRHQSAKQSAKPPRMPMTQQGARTTKSSLRPPPARGGTALGSTASGGPREDARERLARQIQKVNAGFWGTLHANTMHKSQYNQLINSKEAQRLVPAHGFLQRGMLGQPSSQLSVLAGHNMKSVGNMGRTGPNG